jgi:hypothetical protein
MKKKKITVKKSHHGIDGLYVAICGKRKILITMPTYAATLGITPSLEDCVIGFNDTTGPRDKIMEMENCELVIA